MDFFFNFNQNKNLQLTFWIIRYVLVAGMVTTPAYTRFLSGENRPSAYTTEMSESPRTYAVLSENAHFTIMKCLYRGTAYVLIRLCMGTVISIHVHIAYTQINVFIQYGLKSQMIATIWTIGLFNQRGLNIHLHIRHLKVFAYKRFVMVIHILCYIIFSWISFFVWQGQIKITSKGLFLLQHQSDIYYIWNIWIWNCYEM